MSKEILLQAKNVSVRYPGSEKNALESVSFGVYRGEILMLAGGSGSGKSTLLGLLSGLLPGGCSVTGEALFAGKNLCALSEKEFFSLRGGKIGMIFQSPGAYLDPRMTIGAQTAEIFSVHQKVRKKEARRLAEDALTPFFGEECGRIFDSFPFELSGGQLQRASIAMASSLSPSLLLCDEPTSALDAFSAAQTAGLLRALSREKNVSILMTTHNLPLALSLGDRIMILHEGTLVETGTPEALARSPKAAYTKALLQAADFSERRASDGENRSLT